MHERTDPPTPRLAPHVPDHGLTITVDAHVSDVAFSWPWRASCLCGWQSAAVRSRPHAAAEGETHLASTRGHTPKPSMTNRTEPLMTIQTPAALILPPCPWWCTSTVSDHACEYDSVAADDPIKHYRNHSAGFGSVAVVQSESNRLGVVALEPVRLSVYVEGADTVQDAEQLADEMRQAAELMHRITQTTALPTIETEAGTFAVPPCPEWCILPSDHDLDDPNMREFDGVLNRLHRAGEWTVSTVNPRDVVQVSVGWVTTVGAAEPSAAGDGPGIVMTGPTTVDLSPDDARAVAEALTAAVSTLAAITSRGAAS